MADDMPIYKRGSAYYVRIPVRPGEYKRVSLGKISKSDAIEAARAMVVSSGGDMLFDAAVEKWLTSYVSRLRPSTHETYKWAMVSAAPHLQGVKLHAISAAHLSKWEAAIIASGSSASTAKLYVSALSSMMTWLDDNGIYSGVNVAARYLKRGRSRPKATRLTGSAPRERWLTEEEFDLVSERLEQPFRDCAAFLVATGMRRQEMLSMTWDWIKDDRISVPAIASKSGSARDIPILPAARAILTARPRSNTVSNLVWWQIWRGKAVPLEAMNARLQDACERAGVAHATVHDLRRTCGCWLLQGSRLTGGKPLRIEVVSKLLGHADIRITQQRYAFLSISSIHAEVASLFQDGTK